MTEAAAVSPEGRISPDDLGIWSDAHADTLRPIVKFIKSQNAVPGMQLAHAGRKASVDAPWRGGNPLGLNARGWQPIAPSPLPFAPGYATPREMTPADLDKVEMEFAGAARRALAAGFEMIEIHMAHGYLLHSFLSPLSNHRRDDFGGSLENRVRFPLRIAHVVREVWPAHLPVSVRISATDWVDGGWDLAQSIPFSHRLKELRIDLIDCSSGGTVVDAKIPAGPGFQTPFATAIRLQVGIATGAVGLITEPFQAEQIVATGLADAVFLARELLRDPYWPLHAAQALGVEVPWPVQYERAKLRR
jgi:2,4-dienoyl-CoA reductase-like NADH-dependent reductase (Old Yellow Enzyme family)